MSRSATPATRNEATRRLKPPKRTTSAKLPIGTAVYGPHTNGCGRLRTVADGCGRRRNVERTHPQPPDPQSETGTLATHSGKNIGLRTPTRPHSGWLTCWLLVRALVHNVRMSFHVQTSRSCVNGFCPKSDSIWCFSLKRLMQKKCNQLASRHFLNAICFAYSSYSMLSLL